MSKQSFKVCFCFRRIFRLKAAEPPEEIKLLFVRYSENGYMSIDQLHRFLVEVQGEKNATEEDAHFIFNSVKHLNIFPRRELRLDAFFRYLLGDLNLALSPSLGVHHDMNAPLAHYFLYTGHNSYLTGNQLSSDCSVKPIIKALLQGVRVIELDLWPNSTGDMVEVRHGGTLTSPVEFIKCLHAIKDNAFSASEFPLVLTFEDHLTPVLQAKVAKMVTKTFGAMLFRPESEYSQEFPSPASLKKRIIISTKPPKEYLESQSKKRINNSQKDNDSGEEESWQKENSGVKNEVTENKKDESDEGEDHQDEDIQSASPDEYRRLIAIHAGKPKGGVGNWLTIDSNNVRRLSLSEQDLENAEKTHGTDIVRFTQKNLLRVYPKGTRVNSSNYNPHVGWMHGAQMVAFNMQGYGKYLWIMHGMFRANGGCGYVKKPDFLLNIGPNNEAFDPTEKLPVKTTLRVKVYMGEGWHVDFHHTHFDRFSPPDFFVRVGIAGVPADTKMHKTQVIEDDWLPVWNKEFEFPLTVPELALLRIEVLEFDTSGIHDFGGQTCLPLTELRTGIRVVPLCDERGQKYKSVKLLMSFEFIQY
ncbi:phosphoinositide phospholipase C 2-like isoform X2 [Malania oleifera]|uniref:phosphoinositide phospholipase C 2-like isoform X2 n=4 Tax=Malania oleifera TaxID=397392 RepID=UPI0025AE0748|nr:phosphoinositide phospholipase C 2-like isoform X2 [Malania oleifera]